MPKVSEEYSQARRRQIIDAAYRCFARKGFHQTTMRDIYEEAELSAGAVYNYFASKDEIIAGSFEYDSQRSRDVFAVATESEDLLAALEGLVDFFFVGLKSAAALGASRVNVQGWGESLVNPALKDTVRGALNGYRDALSQVIRKGQAHVQISPALDPLALAQTVLSLYYGLELQLALNPELDVDNYTAAVRALLRSLRQPG